jgi:hypothetical protein
MATKAWTSRHAARSRDAADGVAASPARARSGASRRRIERASDAAPLLARPAPPSFFWPIATQQVTRVLRAIPYRDVSAAAACAGAFALWALALSLLAV